MREALTFRPDYEGFVSQFQDRRGLAEFHSHPELEFNLVTRGSAWYMVDDRRFLLVPGTIIWLFPDQEHLLVDVDPNFRMWIAVLSRPLCEELASNPEFQRLGELDPRTVHVGRLQSADSEAVGLLCRSVASSAHSTRFNAGITYLFLEAWAAYESASPLETGSDLSPVVAASLRRIADDGGAVRLSDTARELDVSESWLSRTFHRETGVRFSDYCNRIRLLRFDELRERRPHANLSSLALDAGFGSYAQFYRVYRSAHGTGPRA